jgi:hypothetical protein
VLKSQVVLSVVPVGGRIPFMHESRLNFGPELLPMDYDQKEGREYSLVIKRVK